MIKLYSNQQIQYNLVYFYFLKGLLYLVKTVPPKYGKWILKGAKMVVGVFPAITVLMVSFASVVIQRYFTQEIEPAEKPVNEEENQIKRLEDVIAQESEERKSLSKSSQILMDCIKSIQRKLDDEISCRKAHQIKSEKEKVFYHEKIERIDDRLNFIKGSLKKGILGMDHVLKGIRETKTAELKALKEEAGDGQRNEKPIEPEIPDKPDGDAEPEETETTPVKVEEPSEPKVTEEAVSEKSEIPEKSGEPAESEETEVPEESIESDIAEELIETETPVEAIESETIIETVESGKLLEPAIPNITEQVSTELELPKETLSPVETTDQPITTPVEIQ